MLNSLVGVLITPLVEDLFFVLFVKLLSKFDVHGCYVLKLVRVKLFSFGFELTDWRFYPSHN